MTSLSWQLGTLVGKHSAGKLPKKEGEQVLQFYTRVLFKGTSHTISQLEARAINSLYNRFCRKP